MSTSPSTPLVSWLREWHHVAGFGTSPFDDGFVENKKGSAYHAEGSRRGLVNIYAYQSVLRNAGVVFNAGLTDDEIGAIERRFAFTFPPDLRAFLTAALPVSNGFVDWRNASDDQIRSRLAWPLEGIAFDIEANVFWPPEWGARPEALADAIAVAREVVSFAPRLIPICSHRFIPDRPCEAGNPIFSVYQTDIILYGVDLGQYLENEFPTHFGTPRYQLREEVRRIDFWSRLVDLNDGAV